MDISYKIEFKPAIFQEIIKKLSQIDLFKGNLCTPCNRNSVLAGFGYIL